MSGKLRFYNEKLQGYKKFYQIVKTIKMVTLAKFRQAMGRTKTRDFTLRFSEKSFAFDEETELVKNTLYVPISTNRGLCGPMNSNLYKYLEQIPLKENKLLVIGKKGHDTLSRLYPKEYHSNIFNDMKQAQHFAFATFVYENTLEVPDIVRTQIIFARFVSAGVQRTATYNLSSYDTWLSKISSSASSDKEKKNYQFANALLNLDEAVVRDFYDFHASLIILNALCENELSEFASRLIAVESQMTNISQLQARTLYLYNKTRQGSITASLIEILSAMSAMNQSKSGAGERQQFW